MVIVDAVLIGRNEGTRLVAALAALDGRVRRVVYVDSGSTDGSVAAAGAAGAQVVVLDPARPFTAARARNAGWQALVAAADPPDLVQFLDGDCEIDPDWVATASRYMAARPDLAVVCGRRRERFPAASVYNRLIDHEWDTPIGAATACGGDALMRLDALVAAGGYCADLIAGEEPELCLRLRRQGWGIWRLDAEMTRHDAAMTRLGQWWQRSRRAGHAFAEGAARHGTGPEAHWVAETRRALLWGAGLPLAAVLGAVTIHPAMLLLLLAWPAQVLRLAWRWGGDRPAFERAFFTVLGRLPEAQGALGYWWGRLRGRGRRLIEYK